MLWTKYTSLSLNLDKTVVRTADDRKDPLIPSECRKEKFKRGLFTLYQSRLFSNRKLSPVLAKFYSRDSEQPRVCKFQIFFLLSRSNPQSYIAPLIMQISSVFFPSEMTINMQIEFSAFCKSPCKNWFTSRDGLWKSYPICCYI